MQLLLFVLLWSPIFFAQVIAQESESTPKAEVENGAATSHSTDPAATESSLPSPLTLQYVLSLDLAQHPALLQAQALTNFSKAELLAAESQTGIQSSIQGALRYVEPPETFTDRNHKDNYAVFSIKKRLYDFGYSGNSEDAAELNQQSSEWNFIDTKNQHRINVMRGFFNVLLADLKYIRDNEAMSIAYGTFDKLRHRQELGQISDIDVLEAQTNYQNVRQQFYASRSLQRSSRNQLANLINRPGELAAEVAEPNLKGLFEKIPEFEQLQKQAMENNPQLRSLRQRVAAAEKSLAAARAVGRPVIDSEARWAEYERELGSRNQWELELRLNVPLWTGGASAAAVSRQQAALLQQKAILRQAEMDVGQRLLEYWLRLEELKAQKEEMETTIEFRDLYLDRSRALYELEWKTDLGDSMVQVSDARYRMAKVRYDTAIAKAQLDALLGNEVFPGGNNSEPKAK